MFTVLVVENKTNEKKTGYKSSVLQNNTSGKVLKSSERL